MRQTGITGSGGGNFVNGVLGTFELKGPLLANDGTPIPISQGMVDGLANKAIEALQHNTAIQPIVIDLMRLTDEQATGIIQNVMAASSHNK